MNEFKVLEEIKDMVNEELNINLMQDNRKQEVVYARALFSRLAYEHTHHSLSSIGMFLGRNHATVLHGSKNIFSMFKAQKVIFKHYIEAYEKITKTLFNIDPNKTESLAERLFIDKMEADKKLKDIRKEIEGLKERHNRMLKYFSKYEKNTLEKYGI